MIIYAIYAIHHDDGNISDLDSAIDGYYYHVITNDIHTGDFYAPRQKMVDLVKTGNCACTYPHNSFGAWCKVATSTNGIEYLTTKPDDNPANNLSALPER